MQNPGARRSPERRGILLDKIDRKPAAVIVFGLTSLCVWGASALHGFALLSGALALGMFGVAAILPVLTAFNTELFPTPMRTTPLEDGDSNDLPRGCR